MGGIGDIEELLERLTEQSDKLSTVLTALERLDEQLDAATEIAERLARDAAVEEAWRTLMPPTGIDKPDD